MTPDEARFLDCRDIETTINVYPAWSDVAFAAGFVVVVGMLIWMVILS